MAITIDDFNKIWASTSPLTPYTFSESNYKEGWNFIGSTPPSRQMWDGWLKMTDEKCQYLYNHEDVPVGFEYFTFNPHIPQGSLPLFGGEYSRETYSALWNWVQEQTGYLKTEAEWQTLATANNGNVPYYSDGDGSTTFRVPALNCWMRSANGTVSEVGSYLQAGLPNITGQIVNKSLLDDSSLNMSHNGAFQGARGSNASSINVGSISTQHQTYVSDFDASRSNSIYGNSSTVQPASVVGMWLVKAYGTIADTGVINEQQYIDDRLATKLNVTGGTITGNLDVNGTLKQNNENVLTTSFWSRTIITVTGSVSANNWADFTGNITYPTGYSHAISLCSVTLPSPSNMYLLGWEFNDSIVKVRIFSKAAYSNQSFTVVLSVTK